MPVFGRAWSCASERSALVRAPCRLLCAPSTPRGGWDSRGFQPFDFCWRESSNPLDVLFTRRLISRGSSLSFSLRSIGDKSTRFYLRQNAQRRGRKTASFCCMISWLVFYLCDSKIFVNGAGLNAPAIRFFLHKRTLQRLFASRLTFPWKSFQCVARRIRRLDNVSCWNA